MSLTSTIFQVWQKLYEAIDAVDLGASQLNPDGRVAVHLGFPDDGELGQENVFILTDTPDGDQEQWSFKAEGGRREETYTIPVHCTVDVQGASTYDVLERLQQMSAAVEDAVRNARYAGSKFPRPEVPGVDWWQVASVRPQVWGTANGHVGKVVLTIAVRAHI